MLKKLFYITILKFLLVCIINFWFVKSKMCNLLSQRIMTPAKKVKVRGSKENLENNTDRLKVLKYYF